MLVGIIFAIGIAVGVNELGQRKLAKFYHTVLFMPYFLSWIIVTYVVYAFISSTGLINNFLTSIGRETVNIYAAVKAWPFIFLFANIWHYACHGSIIYLATITGLDQELYEAAAIDGAGKFKQFRFITFPQLVPTIVLLQILAIGRILNGDFDMFYNLPNGAGTLRAAYLTLDVYVYQAMKSAQNLGLPSAAAFFQSITGFILVIVTNGIVRKIEPDLAMY
jgi:putative aldouronate transport system permease protein